MIQQALIDALRTIVENAKRLDESSESLGLQTLAIVDDAKALDPEDWDAKTFLETTERYGDIIVQNIVQVQRFAEVTQTNMNKFIDLEKQRAG